jgi:cytochrome c1
MSHHSKFFAAFAAILLAPTITHAQEIELDAFTGLKMSGDWELVRNNCIACHSPKLITQQRGSEDQWLNMIRWMQNKQNLWQFEPETEARIIAYLAKNYPPQADRRRAAIPPNLMPPNPYAPPSTQPD